MTSDFLAGLDAAVEQRCACLCGQTITVTSPSAYFASEDCSERWHRPAGAYPVDVAALGRLIRDLVRGVWEAMRRAFQALVRAAPGRSASAGGRGTAAAALHTPRTVDPPGGLRAQPLGRPVYRPARYWLCRGPSTGSYVASKMFGLQG